MIRRLIILLLIVGGFAQDELILINGTSIKGEYVHDNKTASPFREAVFVHQGQNKEIFWVRSWKSQRL